MQQSTLLHFLLTSFGNARSPNANWTFVGSISGGRRADITVCAIIL